MDINEHEVCWCSLHPRTWVLKITASIYQQIRTFSCSRHCFPYWATRGGLKSSSVSVGEEVNYSYTILPRTRCSRGLMRNLFLSLWIVKMNIFNPSCAICRALRAREDSWLVFHSAALPANDALPTNICRMGFALVRKGHHKMAYGRGEEPAGNKTPGRSTATRGTSLGPPKKALPSMLSHPTTSRNSSSWCTRNFISPFQRLQEVWDDGTGGKSKHHPGDVRGCQHRPGGSLSLSLPTLPERKLRVE